MRLLDDERGQSVQVGAAILLGFVVIAITIYQVQVVSSQNAEVEFNHNQEVRGDMTDLRNAIKDAGTGESSRSASMQLGTQYPARTIFVNPTPPRGILRTESIGDISIENATVLPGIDYSGEVDPQTILNESHETSRIYYTPNYAEFGGAPTMRIEHSLGYNTFDNGASSPITPQSVVNGDSITLTVVSGNVSEQGTGAVSVDLRTVTATDEIEIEPAGGPITIDLPTDTPDVWNETLGETFDTGESDARVTSWNPTTGTVRVALDRSQYSFQIGMVGVGNGVPQSDRYDVELANGGGSGDGGSSSYSLDWADPRDSDSGGASLRNCDSESCTWDVGASDDDTLDLSASLDPAFDGTDLEFTVDNANVASIDPASATTGQDGSATTGLTAEEAGTVNVRATTDGAGDVIEIEVTNVSEEPSPSIEALAEDLSNLNENHAEYLVSFEVSDPPSDFDSVDVRFTDTTTNQVVWENSSSVAGTVTRQSGGASGNSFDIDVFSRDSEGNVIATKSFSDSSADGVNPGTSDSLGDASAPSFTSRTISGDSSNGMSYTVSYTAETNGFQRVDGYLIAQNSNSGEDSAEWASNSVTDSELSTYGFSNQNAGQMKVSLLLFDARGVVVDRIIWSDGADGSGSLTG